MSGRALRKRKEKDEKKSEEEISPSEKIINGYGLEMSVPNKRTTRPKPMVKEGILDEKKGPLEDKPSLLKKKEKMDDQDQDKKSMSSSLDTIRSDWELPYVVLFVRRFKSVFGWGRMTTEDLEKDLEELKDHGIVKTLVKDMIRKLEGGKEEDEWNTWFIRWKDHVNNYGEDLNVEEMHMEDMHLVKRTSALRVLCDVVLASETVDLGQLMEEADHYRLEPVGKDSGGNYYWYFDDNRLYKEETKKRNDSQHNGKWSLVCYDLPSWNQFKENLATKKAKPEKTLLITLEPIANTVMNRLEYREKETRRMMKREVYEHVPKKRSFRLQAKQTEEEEERKILEQLEQEQRLSKMEDAQIQLELIAEKKRHKMEEKEREAERKMEEKTQIAHAEQELKELLSLWHRRQLKREKEKSDTETVHGKKAKIQERPTEKDTRLVVARRSCRLANVPEVESDSKVKEILLPNELNLEDFLERYNREHPSSMHFLTKNACVQFLQQIKKHECAADFVRPVNIETYPDYLSLIKKPMSISVVYRNLLLDVYATPESMKKDVLLIFENCYKYNASTSPIARQAKRLERASRKFFSQLFEEKSDEKSTTSENSFDESITLPMDDEKYSNSLNTSHIHSPLIYVDIDGDLTSSGVSPGISSKLSSPHSINFENSTLFTTQFSVEHMSWSSLAAFHSPQQRVNNEWFRNIHLHTGFQFG